LTDAGKLRDANEDSFLLCPEHALFAVADGMGAHDSGEVASRLAVEGIKTFFERSAHLPAEEWTCKNPEFGNQDGCRLASSLEYAHHLIVRESHSPDGEHSNMGTTAVALHMAGGMVHVAHVGDSRCYRLSSGELYQLTRDHSLVEEIRDKVDLTEAESAGLAHFAHILCRALGGTTPDMVPVDLLSLPAESGDLFLLCSDGLTNEVDAGVIAQILYEESELSDACGRLVRTAVENGGRDNVTVVVVRCS